MKTEFDEEEFQTVQCHLVGTKLIMNAILIVLIVEKKLRKLLKKFLRKLLILWGAENEKQR